MASLIEQIEESLKKHVEDTTRHRLNEFRHAIQKVIHEHTHVGVLSDWREMSALVSAMTDEAKFRIEPRTQREYENRLLRNLMKPETDERT